MKEIGAICCVDQWVLYGPASGDQAPLYQLSVESVLSISNRLNKDVMVDAPVLLRVLTITNIDIAPGSGKYK